MTHLQDRLALNRELDELIEEAQRDREPLQSALRRVLPHVRQRLGASHISLETLDESLERRRFEDGEESGGETLFCEVDVAGEKLGRLEAGFSGALDEARRGKVQELLHGACEVLDNYLKMIQVAREKHFLMRQLHRDLLHPLLNEGIKHAVETLRKAVSFELLIVVYHQANAYEQSVRYLVFDRDSLEFDSEVDRSDVLDPFMRKPPRPKGSTMLLDRVRAAGIGNEPLDLPDLRDEQGTARLLEARGVDVYLETQLISGLRNPAALGKVVISGARELSTYERDLVGVFAEALQKRVVDFDRESRSLNRSFAVPKVMKLLAEADYAAKYLAPQRREAAVMFTDISGFTRITEQVLQDPVKVGAFIQAWGEGAVEILWQHGGACDKFVGDCLIGLFGPPFFEQTPPEICAAAVRCAIALARFTESFPRGEAWRELGVGEVPLGVATGLNYCQASIGAFGLHCGYTAFSSGVNNTARLQGLAVRHEILVTKEMRQVLEPSDFRFSALRTAQVKNVRDPLEYHEVLWDGSEPAR